MVIPRNDGKRFYSPLVRAIAESEGISLEELQSINGSGNEGRLSKSDVMEYLAKRKSRPAVSQSQHVPQVTAEKPKQAPASVPQTAPASSSPSYTAVPASGEAFEVIPMDRVRQLISEHMVYSKRTSAHVTSVAECDVTQLVKYRDKHKTTFEKREGIKLTYTPFFAKAVVEAVRAFPRINVSVDEKNIIQHKRTNLSFATALEDGNLIVPVIKNSDSLSISGLARAVYDLSFRARNKKLNPDDIQGGTITLTNVGTFGTLLGTPVINQPQCAIIGVGAIKKVPVVREINGEDAIVIRHMMFVSITYDHRVIDGMLAGQALSQIVKNLESMNEQTIVL
jgi:2-oxoglutarate dehydrogenase E2 component (dihydrolipoamide succinyltransferase)